MKKAAIVAIIAVAAIVSGVIYAVGGGGGTTESDIMIDEPPVQEVQPTEDAPLEGEIVIGSILPLTGSLSSHGQENLEGSKLGVVDFNEYLEEKGAGWSIKMLSEDSATNPSIAIERLQSLYAKNVNIIVGPETSANLKQMKGYADSNGILLVSCCSSSPALAIPDDNILRLVPDDSIQGVALAKLAQSEGIEVLIPAYRGDTWGDGLAETTSASFAERGGIVGEHFRYEPDVADYSAETSLLAEEVGRQSEEHGAENVAVLFLGFAEILQFMQSANAHDVLRDVRWFGPGATTKEHKLIDDEIGSGFSNTVMFTTVQVATSGNEKYNNVQQHVKEVLGRTPSTFVHSSYDAPWLIGLAIEATGGTDPIEIRDKIFEIAPTYQGAIGDVTLNEAGDLAAADYEIWGIRDGAWIRLGLYEQSSDTVTLE